MKCDFLSLHSGCSLTWGVERAYREIWEEAKQDGLKGNARFKTTRKKKTKDELTVIT